ICGRGPHHTHHHPLCTSIDARPSFAPKPEPFGSISMIYWIQSAYPANVIL
ncbi:hypothetical protein P691DRAFT_804914, partial [Macrolepiota fuliginosa MF-IS2]